MENVDERDREEEQQNEDSTEQTADLEQDISQQQWDFILFLSGNFGS